MLSRFTCGLVAQLSSVTSCDEACGLRRPGSPGGEHVRRLIDDHRDAEAVGFRGHELLRTKRSRRRDRRRRILRERAEIADLAVGQRDHLLQPLSRSARPTTRRPRPRS